MEEADSFGECVEDSELEKAERMVAFCDFELDKAFERIASLILKKLELKLVETNKP